MGFGGFSWKRALGITKAKQQLSRKIGIPLTKSGRQRKLGSLFYPKSRKRRSNSGCLVMFILTSLFLLSTYSAIFAGEQIAELFHYIQDKDALGEEALPRVIKDAEQGNIHARYVLAARQIDVVKNTEEAIKQLEALSNDGYILAKSDLAEQLAKSNSPDYSRQYHLLSEVYDYSKSLFNEGIFSDERYKDIAKMFAGSSSFQIGKLFMDDASQKEMVAMLAEGVTQEFSSDDIEYALFSIASGNSYNAEVLIMQIAMENKSQPAELIERFISKFGREPHLIDGRHIPPILSSIRETIAQEIEQYQNRVRSGFLEDSAKHGMTEAVKWLGIAADFDDLDAIVTLAKIYRGNDGIPKDDALSFNYFAKAAEMGDSDSMIEVGRRFENGVGIEENLNKAFEYYKLAAEKGNHYGQYNLGICYANGIGVSTDLSEAKRWMEEAQKNGNPGAKAALEQIHTQERIANGAILLTARELVIGYENNELAADGAVKGKIIEVSGIIVSVSQDILEQYYVALQGPRHSFRNVQCFFSQDKLEQLTRLNKGQTITISGRCDGLMMNVILHDCEIIKG